jgi:hypothetical protein
MSEGFPSLPNIEYLIDGNGDITVGGIASIPCAATAVDGTQCLAMLVRRDGETLEQLLIRLDRAIEKWPKKMKSSSMKSTTDRTTESEVAAAHVCQPAVY